MTRAAALVAVGLSLALNAAHCRAEQDSHWRPSVLPAPPATSAATYPVSTAPATVLTLPPPPVSPPQAIRPPVIVYKPLVPVAPLEPPYYLGHGILGQPKLYVPDQPIRNFLRYLSL